jgi:hypothetical protein
MFSALTNSELTALFCRIKSGRDRAYYATGIANETCHFVSQELNGIMEDIHAENQSRPLFDEVCGYSARHAMEGVPAVTTIDCGRVGIVAACQACADFYERMS